MYTTVLFCGKILVLSGKEEKIPDAENGICARVGGKAIMAGYAKQDGGMEEYLVTGKEMRAYDTYTIEHIGIPAMVLMERAALQVAACVEKHLYRKKGRVLCVCGTGNNGGDGLSVVRLLIDKGIAAEAVLIGNREHAGRELLMQLSILEKYGITPYTKVPDGEYDILVDALFGTGLSREITGAYRDAVEAMNQKEAVRISVDIPSGINADTGAVLGAAVRADETVTLAFLKRGLYLYPGAEYAGKISVADIGITKRSFNGKLPGMYTLQSKQKEAFFKRRPDGNKGTFGKLLLVAGSGKMAGAALLAGNAAYRAGAGMVKLVIPEKIREIIQEKLPEALIQTYESSLEIAEAEEEAFLQSMEWAGAVAIGPGLTVCESGKKFLAMAIQEGNKPLIIDADGLNLLAKDEDLRALLQKRAKTDGDSVILTPHMGELARLLGKPVAETVTDETKSVMEAADTFGCIIVGKSARTHVCRTNHPVFLNTAGNDKMATAGSGDVLTGIVAALAVQGVPCIQAASAGVYLHACAGDAAAKKAGNAGITASDIIAGLSLL